MRILRLALLLAASLLAATAGTSSGAAADDVPAVAWRGLLRRPADPPRPVLGLLEAGDAYLAEALLDADVFDRPGGEEEESEEDPDDLVAWLRAWGGGEAVATGRLRRIAVDAEIVTPDGRIHRARLIAAPGRRALLARTRSLRVMDDYTVELACDNSGGLRPSAVGDPRPHTFLDGLALDVRPFVVGNDRVALEVLLQAGAFDAPVARLDTRARFLGDLDLPRYRGALLSASGATQLGVPLELMLADAAGGRYALRLVPSLLDVPAAADRARRPVHRFDASLLVALPADLHFASRPDPWSNPPAHVRPAAVWGEPVADRSAIWTEIDLQQRDAEVRLLPDGDVWLVADAAAARRVGSTLDAWTAGAARTVQVDVTARAADGAVVGRAEVPVLTGRTAFFRLGVDRALLLDSDVEVG
jgi:hypothetical protein